MDIDSDDLELVEVGKVSEETKGFGSGLRDNPTTPPPCKEIVD